MKLTGTVRSIDREIGCATVQLAGGENALLDLSGAPGNLEVGDVVELSDASCECGDCSTEEPN